ncbi:hypothetical protein AMTR_s00255p00016970, partial [Amborella trichopoda]
EAKVTAIQEAKDLTRLPLEELLGSLMTHELTMKNGEEEDDTRRTGALKASTKDDSDESSSNAKESMDEVANLCLMAKEDDLQEEDEVLFRCIYFFI